MYYLIYWKNSEIFDRYIEGLKKAGYESYLEKLVKRGCKGDPFVYYRLNKENRMTGQEIRELLFGKTMRGFYFCTEWSSKINKSGEFVLMIFVVFIKEKYGLKIINYANSMKHYLDGLKFCGEIYKNPEGNKKTLSEYFMLTDFFLFPFSIEETGDK